ncbi:MAG: ferrous iron transport protein A [Coriobacteriales bacterium]|jgi:Fe2+ transport system protein FeoA|nr:ferrous iron transport protein A [Coriobacteriales bacterium]
MKDRTIQATETAVLDEAAIGRHYRIEDCTTDGRTRQKLECLGVVTGGQIEVISNTSAGLIVNVRNSRLALSHELARQLQVEES